MKSRTCVQCGASGTMMRYCDKTCQRADWKRHKPDHKARIDTGGQASTSGSGEGGYQSRIWPFGFPIRTQAQLDRAAEACAAHDRPFNLSDLFDSTTFSGNGKVVCYGGGMADAPKGPPLLPGARLGLIGGELWFFVTSAGGDLRDSPNEDAPHCTEAAELTGNFLSYYFNDLKWRGAGCFAAEKAPSPLAPEVAALFPAAASEGIGFGARRLGDLPEERGYSRMEVVATATNMYDMAPLKAYMRTRGLP